MGMMLLLLSREAISGWINTGGRFGYMWSLSIFFHLHV